MGQEERGEQNGIENKEKRNTDGLSLLILRKVPRLRIRVRETHVSSRGS